MRCEEEVSYCRKFRKVMAIAGATDIPAALDFVLWYFERSYAKLHFFCKGRLRNRVLTFEDSASHCCKMRVVD